MTLIARSERLVKAANSLLMSRRPGGDWATQDAAWAELDEAADALGASLDREQGAVADRDALAAYVAWRWTPVGDAPITLDDLRMLMARLGHTLPGGQ
jgi:hypothetical protein